MLIKMLTLQAGPTGTREAGQVYDVSTKEAQALIEGGYAMKVEREAPVVEKAVSRRNAAKPKVKDSTESKPGDEA